MPPSPQPQQPRTHYDLLGVPRTASIEEIKKRYRELARKHHPDVNPGDPNASRVFSEITAAYKILSDTGQRQTYDAELLLKEKRAATATARAKESQFPGTQTYYPGGVGGGYTPPPRPRPQQTPSQAAANNAQNVSNEVNSLLQQAQAALTRARYVEARDLAQQSLRLRRTAEGYEILGDVYRFQNRVEEAMNMYTMALQINPRNQRVMDRLQRIARANPSASSGGGGGGRPSSNNYDAPPGYRNRNAANPASSATPSFSTAPVSASPLDLRGVDKRPLALLLAGLLGYGATLFVLLFVAFYSREAPLNPLTPLGPVSTWNGTLFWALPLSGVLLGVTMAITGAIRRIDDELVFTMAGARGGANVPMGLVLLVLSAISFWAAALLHLILSALQETRLDSILKVFGAVAAVVLFVTSVYDAGRLQVFLVGGNVVFLAFAFGWFLGDIFRPDY